MSISISVGSPNGHTLPISPLFPDSAARFLTSTPQEDPTHE
jgi:hypothetical protein